ncbi:MAG: hypothetical protein ACJAWM_000551 [Sulfitobacter sp.]|jgi:hypothetical protein
MVERWISKTVPAHFGFFAQILPGSVWPVLFRR